MRLAVVSEETHGDTKFYWYEVAFTDPSRGPQGRMIMQSLVAGPGAKSRTVRAVVVKSGDQPAMRMPPQMVEMMNSTPGSNVAAEIARQCQEMAVVGSETVTVPGGRFTTIHLRHRTSGTEVWIEPTLNFALVKATMQDGGAMELTGQGMGAKSSITETPREMTGFPVPPPPR
jgi:antitoxin component of MazEF toxin-antitoxin module